LGLLAPLREGVYEFSSGQPLLILQDLIHWSPAEVQYRKRRNSALEGVIMVTVHILDTYDIIFRDDPFGGI
jgi:hypothetical protein